MSNLEKLRLGVYGLPILEGVDSDAYGDELDEPPTQPKELTSSEYNRARQILANCVGYVHDAASAMKQMREDPDSGAPVDELLGQAQKCIEVVRKMRGSK